jgi:hypothetical protein
MNQVFQSFLTFRLSVEEFFFLLQEGKRLTNITCSGGAIRAELSA